MEASARSDSLDRNGWVEIVDEHGIVVYKHVQSGHCQSHLPVVAAPSEYKSMKSAKSRRSLAHHPSSNDDEKMFQTQALRNVSRSMISDYMAEVDKFNMAKPYARHPDGTYDDSPCVVCKAGPTHMVFFPCQHKCVCDSCIKSLGGTTSFVGGCPVCLSEVKVMFEYTGREADEYWDWVYDVKPHLSRAFDVKFKATAFKLAKTHGTGAVVVPTNDHGVLHRRISQFLGRPHQGPLPLERDHGGRRKTCVLM